MLTISRMLVMLTVLGLLASTSSAATQARLLRRPTVSEQEVAFAYAGDLWIVSRDGGRARRLTSTPTVETDPRFSPDGTKVAFTATAGGNTDVYVMPAAGGEATRLTYHPGMDFVRGWTRDGRQVIFGSGRETLPTPRVSSYSRLWKISAQGGAAQPLPMPRAHTGSLSPNEDRIAYEEFATEFEVREAQLQSAQWRHYRGGRTHPIRIMKLSDGSEQRLPWSNSNDSDPMWVGDTVYFISDRAFTANLFSYDTRSGRVEQLTHHVDYDVMNASAGAGAIVYEQAGYIHLLRDGDRQSRRLDIHIEAAFPWSEPQTKSVADMVRAVDIGAGADRVAIEARGDIFVRAGGSGAIVNYTQTPGTHERSPKWSSDGRLAWLSDAAGEYELVVGTPGSVDQSANKRIKLPAAGFYSTPVWSPDGTSLLLQDHRLTLWMIEIASGRATRIDGETYDDPGRRMTPVWSPDSRWIAYSRNLANHLRAIFLYSTQERRAHQLTDAGVDAVSPAFDRDGSRLYFLVSTDYAQNMEWAGLSHLDRPVTRSVHAVTLRASESPVARLGERIARIDIPAGNYEMLLAGPAGTLFYTEHTRSGVAEMLSGPSFLVHRYEMAANHSEVFMMDVDSLVLSVDGSFIGYRKVGEGTWNVAATNRRADALDARPIQTSELRMRVEPRAEWAHIFKEAWRNQRDYFYQPSMHGANWQAIYEKYEPLVAHVNHRADLGYVLAMTGGELSVGHSSLAGFGDVPTDEPVKVGMLGADFSVDRNRYRIARILRGDPWDTQAKAPLVAPDANVQVGDYLFEVNGKAVTIASEVYAAFEKTAETPTELRIGPTPDARNSRLVTVTPTANEEPLRTFEDWTEHNRRLVAQRSDGRIGYVWLVDTGPHGFQAFNRQFFAQNDKRAMIVDVRYNQGGYISDYIVETLTRPRFGYLVMREGASAPMPFGAVFGPKAMLINESSGSGGDAIAYQFRRANAGPLIGTRTWGGLVGAQGAPPDTLDGGGISAPNASFYDELGQWLIENQGVAPDIQVENEPARVMAGEDPQLERAIAELLERLDRSPPKNIPPPLPPSRAGAPVISSTAGDNAVEQHHQPTH
ncbi:MAG TPA: PDZ domain-containing protein [Steroidobacter sp.]|uniref:S41 family peptidase n=1 Tax=Steroidobacter sp. TaxID=1978227 RepID=UPI002ED8EB4E